MFLVEVFPATTSAFPVRVIGVLDIETGIAMLSKMADDFVAASLIQNHDFKKPAHIAQNHPNPCSTNKQERESAFAFDRKDSNWREFR